MKIRTARGGLFATNSFLIADETSGEAVIFDAPDNTVGVLLDQAKKQKLNVVGLWLTHGHIDHIADHAAVTEAFPQAKVLLHKLDEPKLLHPEKQYVPLPFIIPGRSPDVLVEDGQEVQFGSLKAQVIFTPGHSPGHVCYYFAEQKILVGGDLIICGGVGRTDFPDGDPPEMDRSLRRIMELPDDVTVLPGHCDISTLGHERETNPFIREALGT